MIAKDFDIELQELITKYGVHKTLKMPPDIIATLIEQTLDTYMLIQLSIDESEANLNDELLHQNFDDIEQSMEEMVNSMPEENPSVW